MEKLLNQISAILDGIDRQETEYKNNIGGWWETSTGAYFGNKKLNELKDYIKSNFNPK